MKKRIRDPEKQRAYAQKHYAANREAMIAKAAAAKMNTRARARSFIFSYLQDKACVDCGESDPVVLEFDHRGDKEFAIGTAVKGSYGVKRIQAEVEKCDIRCANCHRRKTYKERGLNHRG